MNDTDSKTFGAMDRTLLGASAGFGIAYFAVLPIGPFPGDVVIKGLAVFLLSVVAWRSTGGVNGALLTLGLLASSLGDVFLGIDRVGLFVQGLASFLVAHLLYVAVFLRLRPKPLVLSGIGKALVAMFVIYGAGLSLVLFPHLGAPTVPVLIYALAITAMGVASILAGFAKPWVTLGAILFIASDSAIAIDKFLAPIFGVGYFIWSSYYLAQILIATGVIAVLARQRQSVEEQG